MSSDTLSFVVYHPFGGRPPVVENYEVNPTASLNVNLKEALSSLPLAQENFTRAEILLNVPYTLVPIETFEEEKAIEIYRLNFHDSEYDRVFYDGAGALGAAIVYGMSDAFCRVIDDNFQTAHFTSTITAVANRFAEAARGGKANSMYLYRHEGVSDMFVFRAGRLLLGNRFATGTTDDAVYFILLAVKTLGLSTDNDEFYIIDDEKSDVRLADALRRFVANPVDVGLKNVFGNSALLKADNVGYDLAAYLMQPY